MLDVHQFLLIAHIIAGSVALFLFWAPMLAKKGSPLHRKSGRYYAYLLYGVSLSGMLMSAMVLIAPLYFKAKYLTPGADPAVVASNVRLMASFLGLLSLLSWVSIRQAMLVLQLPKNAMVLKTPLHLLAVVLLLVAGLYVFWLGLAKQQTLLIVFSVVAVLNAAGTLRFIFKTAPGRMEILRQHISNMLGSAIAIYTAFSAFGGRGLLDLSATGQLISWLAPSVVGVAFMMWYNRNYQDKTTSDQSTKQQAA
jgi:hypothetical protein